MKSAVRRAFCCVATKRCYKIAGTLANLLASNFRLTSFANPSDCMSTMITADILDLAYKWLYFRRTLVKDGIYRKVQQGIPPGCSLSPSMVAVYLKLLDEAMETTGLFDARFMDNWVVLAPPRWQLRNVSRIINQVLKQLEVWQHPYKTFVGRGAKVFDFPGHHLKPNGLRVAEKTRQRSSHR